MGHDAADEKKKKKKMKFRDIGVRSELRCCRSNHCHTVRSPKRNYSGAVVRSDKLPPVNGFQQQVVVFGKAGQHCGSPAGWKFPKSVGTRFTRSSWC